MTPQSRSSAPQTPQSTEAPAVTETLTRERVTPETVSPLKPSEALRLGRLIRPRRTANEFFEGTTGACALGSMLAGAGYTAGDPGYDDIEDAFGAAFPALPFSSVNSPAAECDETMFVDEMVAHLNDDHFWTDAQIGSWLESLGL